MRTKSKLLLDFSMALENCIGKMSVEDILEEIVEQFEQTAIERAKQPDGDPVFWEILSWKMGDLIAVCRNGYSESDLVDAGLIDIPKKD